MSETRLLSACLVLSVILHVAILALPGVRIAPDVDWPRYSVNAMLSVTIRSQMVVADPGLVGVEFPLHILSPKWERQSASTADAAASGLRGLNKETPVVERSVDDYLPPSLLDGIPRPIGNVDTDIDFKGMHGVVGDAEIMLLISSEGEVDDILLMNSTLPGFVIDEAIVRFRALAFYPGEIGGVKVRSRIRIRLAPPVADELLGNPYSLKQRAWKR